MTDMPARPEADGGGAGASVKHHYVPRGYLAPFTSDGAKRTGKVWAYPRGDRDVAVHSRLDGVAFEDALYDVPAEEGYPPADFERFLAREIEAPFLSWQRSIVNAPRGRAGDVFGRMTPAQRTAIARYLAYQQQRTPAHRLLDERISQVGLEQRLDHPDVVQGIEELYDRMGAWHLQPLEEPGRARGVRIFAEAMRIFARERVATMKALWLRPIQRLAEAGALIIRDELVWRLVELPPEVARERQLVTCDDPLVLARPGLQDGPQPVMGDLAWGVRVGAGWREPGLQASLALSPRHVLLLARTADALAFADDPVHLAHVVRVRTARAALRWVYARAVDAEVQAVARSAPAREVHFVIGGVPFGPDVHPRLVSDAIRLIDEPATEIRYTG